MRIPSLFALTVVTSLSATALADPWSWDVKDDSAGPCACSYVAPSGSWKAKPYKDGKLTWKKSGAELTIKAIVTKATAQSYVAKALEEAWMSDCGDTPKPEEVDGWTCGASGGCNGMWETSICARTQPHPDGGEQLLVLQVATDPKNTAGAGGIKALAAAGG